MCFSKSRSLSSSGERRRRARDQRKAPIVLSPEEDRPHVGGGTWPQVQGGAAGSPMGRVTAGVRSSLRSRSSDIGRRADR